MKTVILLSMLALLGLGTACNRDRGDDIQREDATEEIGHEMDEAGDNVEDAAEEVTD